MYKRIHRKWFFMLALGLMTSLNSAVYAQQGEGSEASPAMTFKKVPIKLPRIGTLFSVDKSDEGISNPVVQPLFKNYLNGLTVGGFYRGFFYSRNMTNNYGGGSPEQILRVGDYQLDPILMLYFGGNMTPNTSLGADISAGNPFLVYRGPGYGNNGVVSPYFTVVLRGSFKTKLGTFNMKAGGIEFLAITPFTFGANVNFNRYSIFERRPWDPNGNVKTRYASYYYSGTINQDARFGTQAYKGYVLNGFIPSINTNVDFFYGKTAPNGGIDRIHQTRPTSNIGARIKKNFKSGNYVSLNTFNSFQHSDSVNRSADVQWNIFTSEYYLNYKGFTLSGEVGAGRYVSPTVKEAWSEGFMADLTIPKRVIGIPIALRYYQIGRNFTSNVANFNNATVSQVNTGYGGSTNGLLTPFGPALENVGDLSNNRRGVAINLTSIKVWKFSFTTGTQISAEMEKIDSSNFMFFSHRVNNLVWQRLPNEFPVTSGPYGPQRRITSFYRGVSEKVNITDRNSDGTPTSKKYFNSLDIQAKFKNKIFNRDFYMFYLGTFSSAQNSLSAVPKFDDEAYIRAQFHELDIYYNITSNLVLALYGGLEYVKGNQYTDISPVTGKPINQVGTALGYGFDFAISQSTSLYFRQRWFTFEDKSFLADPNKVFPPNPTSVSVGAEKFSGSEATVELKFVF